MENAVGLAIESLVAVLLVATIVYCATLDRRLKRLRTDEGAMRETVAELVAATHAAERAIVALKAAVGQCEETLSDRLGRAQQMSEAMAGQLGEGEAVIGRIARIAKAAREHAQSEAGQGEAAGVAAALAPLPAAPKPAPRIEEALSPSAATARAAELFASRIRALSLGAAT